MVNPQTRWHRNAAMTRMLLVVVMLGSAVAAISQTQHNEPATGMNGEVAVSMSPVSATSVAMPSDPAISAWRQPVRSGSSRDPAGSPVVARLGRPRRSARIRAWWGMSLISGNLWGATDDVKYMPIDLRYSYEFYRHRQSSTMRYSPDITALAMLDWPTPAPPPLGTIFNQRTRAYGSGISPVGFQWDFMPLRRVQPFLSSDGGFLYFDKPTLSPEGSHWMYTVDFGGGFNIFHHRNQAITIGYRYQHSRTPISASITPARTQTPSTSVYRGSATKVAIAARTQHLRQGDLKIDHLSFRVAPIRLSAGNRDGQLKAPRTARAGIEIQSPTCSRPRSAVADLRPTATRISSPVNSRPSAT